MWPLHTAAVFLLVVIGPFNTRDHYTLLLCFYPLLIGWFKICDHHTLLLCLYWSWLVCLTHVTTTYCCCVSIPSWVVCLTHVTTTHCCCVSIPSWLVCLTHVTTLHCCCVSVRYSKVSQNAYRQTYVYISIVCFFKPARLSQVFIIFIYLTTIGSTKVNSKYNSGKKNKKVSNVAEIL